MFIGIKYSNIPSTCYILVQQIQQYFMYQIPCSWINKKNNKVFSAEIYDIETKHLMNTLFHLLQTIYERYNFPLLLMHLYQTFNPCNARGHHVRLNDPCPLGPKLFESGATRNYSWPSIRILKCYISSPRVVSGLV